MKWSITYFYRETKGGLYTTRNDPRPQMIPKIDLNTTRNDPDPNFFTLDLKWSPRNYRNGIGWLLIPEDARITRIKSIKEFWLELFEVLMYL